jgi:hypothetical protein
LAVTVCLSVLPLASEYRDALSIGYFAGVFIGPLFGGIAVAGLVAFLLLRFSEQLPTRNPLLKAMTLSIGALCIATVLTLLSVRGIGEGALRTFVIGTTLNVPRFLALGAVVGCLSRRLNGSNTVKG